MLRRICPGTRGLPGPHRQGFQRRHTGLRWLPMPICITLSVSPLPQLAFSRWEESRTLDRDACGSFSVQNDLTSSSYVSLHIMTHADHLHAGKASSLLMRACDNLPFACLTRALFTQRANRFSPTTSPFWQGNAPSCVLNHRFNCKNFFCQADLRLTRVFGAMGLDSTGTLTLWSRNSYTCRPMLGFAEWCCCYRNCCCDYIYY